MYELLDNTKYLIDVILPMAQEVQRDSTNNKRISVDISINNDNGLIRVSTTYYKEDFKTIDQDECGIFCFYSHNDNNELYKEFSRLVDYMVKHTA